MMPSGPGNRDYGPPNTKRALATEVRLLIECVDAMEERIAEIEAYAEATEIELAEVKRLSRRKRIRGIVGVTGPQLLAMALDR